MRNRNLRALAARPLGRSMNCRAISRPGWPARCRRCWAGGVLNTARVVLRDMMPSVKKDTSTAKNSAFAECVAGLPRKKRDRNQIIDMQSLIIQRSGFCDKELDRFFYRQNESLALTPFLSGHGLFFSRFSAP